MNMASSCRGLSLPCRMRTIRQKIDSSVIKLLGIARAATQRKTASG
ncbi:hypothetical protein MGSAQ_000667 [marine sediment metagenome]|uniref:Uncharacterized protein n=1 Tax=marine sediment metagenome TaxID=412755 RepID=A0A1B6NYI5_9ZZZZ